MRYFLFAKQIYGSDAFFLVGYTRQYCDLKNIRENKQGLTHVLGFPKLVWNHVSLERIMLEILTNTGSYL